MKIKVDLLMAALLLCLSLSCNYPFYSTQELLYTKTDISGKPCLILGAEMGGLPLHLDSITYGEELSGIVRDDQLVFSEGVEVWIGHDVNFETIMLTRKVAVSNESGRFSIPLKDVSYTDFIEFYFIKEYYNPLYLKISPQ